MTPPFRPHYGARIRVALIQQGDPARAGSWSGVPAGLTGGLRLLGCEVVPIDSMPRGAARIGNRLGLSWADQSANRAFAAASTATANRRLRRAGAVDGAVMIGSGYTLSSAAPVVTLEDMTVSQALRQPEPDYEAVGDAAGRRWQARQRRNYESARACCLASEWAARSVREDYDVAAAKVQVVGFGSNVELGEVARDWSPARFLFVGVDWVRKGGDAVLEAFAAVRRRHPDARLALVGRHDEVKADGVTDHGLLPLGTEQGRRRYLELLEEATCLVMPSRFEPYGIAYLDAAVAGIPSIGTTVGGAPEAIAGCGRVVDPGDGAALVEAMSELADPAVAAQLGARGRARLPQVTWRAVAERVLLALGLEGRS